MTISIKCVTKGRESYFVDMDGNRVPNNEVTGNLKYTVVETFTESYNPTTTKLPEFKPAEQISCFRELGEAIERSGRGVGFKGDEKTVADYRKAGFGDMSEVLAASADPTGELLAYSKILEKLGE